MAIDSATALSLFYRALAEEIGIAIKVDDPKMFRAELSAARLAANDPELDKIITFIPADLGEVWLCKKSADAP